MDNLREKVKKICQEYLKKLEEESTTGSGASSSAGMTTGTGEQYATPFAFNSNKNSRRIK